MNKYWFYLGAISSLSILTTSCGGDSKPPTPAASPAATAPATPPATPATPVPAATTAATPTKTTPAAPAATAAKPGDPVKTPIAIKPVSVDVAAGLIPPTDGESWAKTVAKGRPDPFGMLALQPIEVIEPIDPLVQAAKLQQSSVKVATTNTVAQPSARVTTNTAAKPSVLPIVKIARSSTKTTKVAGTQKIASNSKNQTVAISAIPRTGINRAVPKITVALKEPVISRAKPTSKVVSNSKIIAAKPVLNKTRGSGATDLPIKTQIAAKPERIVEKPLQAMAVEISGVIEVSGRTQVIVKLPTESFSRYIEVGERVADGKVLIKRVEGQNSLSPTVVLEEVGVEVPRKIGDRTSASEVPMVAPTIVPAPATAPAPIR